MFNKFIYQNKFVIEKHIKFVIETNIHIKLTKQLLLLLLLLLLLYINNATLHIAYKINIQKNLMKNSILKKIINLYKIKKKSQMNYTHLNINQKFI
jgi:hypothetical protein